LSDVSRGLHHIRATFKSGFEFVPTEKREETGSLPVFLCLALLFVSNFDCRI